MKNKPVQELKVNLNSTKYVDGVVKSEGDIFEPFSQCNVPFIKEELEEEFCEEAAQEYQVKKETTINVKGIEKITWLQQFIRNSDAYNFYELEYLIFPSMRKQKNQSRVAKCPNHSGMAYTCTTENTTNTTKPKWRMKEITDETTMCQPKWTTEANIEMETDTRGPKLAQGYTPKRHMKSIIKLMVQPIRDNTITYKL
uniref:(California timema) hypothetical protein n=1 Tax=Timema californicum TaxID=61474 RepID=A0A7R9IWF2_TIMCA|nr:unnamed protein product [Timema californicum]